MTTAQCSAQKPAFPSFFFFSCTFPESFQVYQTQPSDKNPTGGKCKTGMERFPIRADQSDCLLAAKSFLLVRNWQHLYQVAGQQSEMGVKKKKTKTRQVHRVLIKSAATAAATLIFLSGGP